MPYGKLTDEQIEALRLWVAGREVHDLGAGTMERSRKLLELGATRVVAVDKELLRGDGYCHHPKIDEVEEYFHDYRPRTPIVTALLAWPANYTLRGLLELLQPAERLIYLGKNTEGTACGWPNLFAHFLTRPLLAHVPDRRNTLLVLGPVIPGDPHRLPTEEEHAGLFMYADLPQFPYEV